MSSEQWAKPRPLDSPVSVLRTPLWWQEFDAERQDRRLRDAARALRNGPALDAFGGQAATIADEILAHVTGPSSVLTTRDWRAVQDHASRLLALARLAEAYASRV